MQLDEPLSDAELIELDDFLLSDIHSDECMVLMSLHGFFTALVVGPEAVPPSEWLPQVWGSSVERAPEFESAAQAERVMELMLRLMNEIAVCLEAAPEEFKPLFDQYDDNDEDHRCVDAQAWSYGFMRGLEMRHDAWQPFLESSIGTAVLPMHRLNFEMPFTEEMPSQQRAQFAALPDAIAGGVLASYRFWLAQRNEHLPQPVRRAAGKVGRNDPCPCGSGKKYKHCCAAGTLH
jgi:uncharacterized protein